MAEIPGGRVVAKALKAEEVLYLVVEALGGHGEYAERPEQIRPALDGALAAGKPALVNIKLGSSAFRHGSVSM